MHFPDPKTYFVYIMSNRSKTLCTGVTNNLIRRVRKEWFEHHQLEPRRSA
ncbi:hypothetical protein SBA1_590013 [Candidatus Sulfotelmatobacter kueseliae]|uniref:GIY-YIG domain-containing protein n=1 Tax=Candidatus Sulfotelmatobacter kueseliae TaxID=2042962 RepID=A0A2U3L0F9_9BACT|nr:hypothetical protein SBA1_590013 [Candidatus Sulfotelmatobacter kueseliae]